MKRTILFLAVALSMGLQPQLLLQRTAEGEVGLDDGILAQRALGIDVGLTELLLRHRHVLALIGVPDHLAPVVATRIECAAVVEYKSFYHLLSVFIPLLQEGPGEVTTFPSASGTVSHACCAYT